MVNNVLSNLWLSRMVAPEMRERRDGSIIYIISVAAMRATTVLGMCGVTKAADYALCRDLAVEWGPTMCGSTASPRSRQNRIRPGAVRGPAAPRGPCAASASRRTSPAWR